MAPLAITSKSTKPSGISRTTNAPYIRPVAIWFLLRRQPPGSRRSMDGWSDTTAIRHPRSAASERSTTQRAIRLTRIVITNRTRPRPISADRNSPEDSPNSFAMTAGME